MQYVRIFLILPIFWMVACGQSCKTAKSPISESKENRSDLIVAVCDILYGNFYDPEQLDHAKLFNAGLEKAVEVLKRKNIEFSPKKVQAETSFEKARIIFANEIERASHLLPHSDNKAKDELYFHSVGALLEAVGDSHTGFIWPSDFEEWNKQQADKPAFSGIGAKIRKLEEKFYYIEYVFDTGPAYKAGLRQFDRLISVNGEPIPDSVDGIVSMIRGPPGTKVVIVATRAGKEVSFEITRQEIAANAVHSEIVQAGDKKIYHLRIYAFQYSALAETLKALEKANEEKVSGLIVDVRSNPGGWVSSLEYLLNIFLPSNTPTFITKSRRVTTSHRTTLGPLTDLPMAVLLNDHSTSAAEIFPAVIQENKRAKLVGQKSAGMVSVGQTYYLPYGAGVIVTVAELTTAGGKKLEKVGVMPDIEVKLAKEDILAGRDAQLEKAIEILK